MTVKTDHGTFECRELTFADRRKLHRLEVSAVDLKTGEMNSEKFFDVLEFVMNFAFKNPDKELASMDDNIIDEVLIAIYNKYKKGPSKKKS
jgi:hypothetical protein|tara:strand:+ start:4413 stop:4685 length:273 start_codon:yes stop_codon:yes gene_type:complete